MSSQQVTVGLTGGIGTGKSTVCKALKRLGIPVFSADTAVHEILHTHDDVINQIKGRFPGVIVDSVVDRSLLGKVVFGNEQDLQWLEGIIHPRVGEMRNEFLKLHMEAPLFVSEIPLLFEVGMDKDYDKTAVVMCSEEEQRRRVLNRPGMTEEKLGAIFQRQLSLNEKESRADYVINTDGTKRETFRQLGDLLVACG